MNENVKDQDVLLVTEKGGNKLSVVAGMNADGTPKTVKPQNMNEPEFLKIDKHGDVLENFMSNFLRQCKDPTHFHFFKVPANQVESVAPVLEEMLKNPETPSNKEILDMHRVLPEEFAPKQYQALDESRIDWKQLESIGITREKLEKTNSLDKMLNWQKSSVLLPVKIEMNGTSFYTDARLSFRESPEGDLKLRIHSIRKEPELDLPFFGVRFTGEEKKNLRETGNAGRLIEIEPVKDQKMLAFVSVDKLTNELVAVRADKIKIPETIKGVQLNDRQKKDLSEGKAIYLENMLSKKNTPFNASIQVNADTRGLEFKFDNTLRQNQSQNRHQKDIPQTFRKQELSEEQQSSLSEGRTVYVSGLTDKNGKPYNGYITWNKESAKMDFMFPGAYKEALINGTVTPDNNHKTQVAVNSEGKTTETTKNIKEPLDKGQTQPTEKQKEKQE
ncbi:hypothetical protein EZS27_027932, partial [termite gut metagenome]